MAGRIGLEHRAPDVELFGVELLERHRAHLRGERCPVHVDRHQIVVPRDRPEALVGPVRGASDRGFLPQAPEPLERDALDEVVRVGEIDPIERRSHALSPLVGTPRWDAAGLFCYRTTSDQQGELRSPRSSGVAPTPRRRRAQGTPPTPIDLPRRSERPRRPGGRVSATQGLARNASTASPRFSGIGATLTFPVRRPDERFAGSVPASGSRHAPRPRSPAIAR